ncbi:MAG: GAF domain-containing protein [Lachnospiraceae bacterium]|nr:GAF domain-containing protein [Lachnospiraceae bacterium]
MSYFEVNYPTDKKAFYIMLKEQLALYTDGETDRTAVLANASSVIAQAFPDANWVGFYLVSGDELVVGPFQGKPAVSRIAYGKGVCGTAWKEEKAQVVEEVSCFPGHIACDCSSRSEIVIPLKDAAGEMWGVLDMDSVQPAYFSEEDRIGLEEAVKLLMRIA